jgi:protocatechuate 3,4-dioxygenase alpha subunit
MKLHATSSQTVGPFFSIGVAWLYHNALAPAGVSGEPIAIQGRVLEGDGNPVPDSMLEIWQANAHGKYAHPEDVQPKLLEPDFKGFGRISTDEAGNFRFTSIKPGRIPGPGGKLQAPHILVSVFARGLLRRLVTRIYFPDDPANAADFALNLVDPARRGTLIAKRTADAGVLEWNVILQGSEETIFFDC